MNKKKYIMDIKIHYKGQLSKKNEIGRITIEFTINKESNLLVETSNSYEIEGERDITPKSIIKIHCVSSKIIKFENIDERYDADFKYSIEKGAVTFITKGINVNVQFGLQKLVKD